MSQLLGSKTYVTSDGSVPVLGVTDGSNAAAGYVGEYVTAQVYGSSVALTTNTPTNITSISLTAGDWDVSGIIGLNLASTTVLGYATGGANTVSATLAGGVSDITFYLTSAAFGSAVTLQNAIRTKRISIGSTTTVYLVIQVGFTVSTASAYGAIAARRVR